jgi:large subunit ribosomal protein L17
MRHKVKGRKLSRTASHRKATMRALTTALVKEHRIVTTIAKAKELRRFIEPLITRAKEDAHHNRKEVFSSLQDKDTVTLLFNEVGPKSKDRPGGYTRIIKIGHRQGDGAEMAVIELVDYNDIQPEGKATKKKRTRRAGKSNTSTPTTKEAETPVAVEESVAEEVVATEQESSEEVAAEETTSELEDSKEEEEASDEDTEEKK